MQTRTLFRRLRQKGSIAILLGALCVPPLFAQGSFPSAQYSVTAWGHKDGLPSTRVCAVTQTPDGFLWLGTADGLVRFDGVRFFPWHPQNPADAPGEVRALQVTRSGDLLFGTASGTLGKLNGQALRTVRLDSAVESITQATDNTLWVATSSALWHLDPDRLRALQSRLPLPAPWLSGPLEDEAGEEWVSTSDGIFLVQPDGSFRRSFGLPAWLFRLQDHRLGAVLADGNLLSLAVGAWQPQATRALPRKLALRAVTLDSSNQLWMASTEEGVLHQRLDETHPPAYSITRSDGLSSNAARFVFEDREHNLWVATENGINRLRRDNVLSLTHGDGLVSNTVNALSYTNRGLWLATPIGLERLERDGRHSSFLHGTAILSLYADGPDRLWMGTSRGLARWDQLQLHILPADRAFHSVTALARDRQGALWFFDEREGLYTQQGTASPREVNDPHLLGQRIITIAAVRDGDVWFGLANGNMVQLHNGSFQSYGEQNGLRTGAVRSIVESPAGRLWAATDAGLCVWTNRRFRCLGADDGLPGEHILWALPDARGDLWLGYSVGLAEITRDALAVLPTTTPLHLTPKLFDDGDGIRSSPVREGNAPAAFTPDARLWFTTSDGVSMLDPARLHKNDLPPPVRILGLQADGRSLALTQPLRLPPLTRSLQIAYTGLSFSDPRKMRFAYRLEGFDKAWHDAVPGREAAYTNLSPGRYTFQVRAANNDGVWNNSGARLKFVLLPAFYQTAWFRLLMTCMVLLAAVLLYRSRLRSAQRELRLRYEERMEERTRIAQNLHDHLIQEIVGISMQLEIADELTPAGSEPKRAIARALELFQSAIASGRWTLHTLRSLPASGVALLEGLKSVEQVYPSTAHLEYVLNGEDRLLNPEIVENLSDLGQEALRNAIKYANHGAIRIHLHSHAHYLQLTVSDQGPGIEPSVLRDGIPHHFGLLTMRERAERMQSELTIDSTPGQGTTVRVTIPAARAYQEHRDNHRFGALFQKLKSRFMTTRNRRKADADR